jgi:predicted short-subunit dehydrogenase-like oxidoreductase (DUF2520 family)
MKICLLGSGNVATFYAQKFLSAKCNITQIYSPRLSNAAILANIVNAQAIDNLSKIDLSADIFIIALKDEALEIINAELKLQNKLVIHCSGSNSIDKLKNTSEHRGIIWPIYSIHKSNLPPNDFNVPIIIDASNNYLLTIVERISLMISSNLYVLNDIQRSYMHLNAVMVNNFTNHLIGKAQEISQKLNLPFQALTPIIKQTISNVSNTESIYNLQTGPAIREDYSTLNKHIDILEKIQINPDYYIALSKSIIDTKHFK